SAGGGLLRPLHSFQLGYSAASVSGDLPARVLRNPGLDPAGINSHHDALRTEIRRSLPDQIRVLYRRSIQRDLVGARPQNGLDVLQRPEPSTHGKWNEHMIGDLPNHARDDLSAAGARPDVQEHELC